MAPNLVQWDRVWPYCTGGGLCGLFWDIMGHFRVILGACLEPISSLFLTRLATQNDLNGPKYGTVGHGMTILYRWGPLGAIFGHFGVILGPRVSGWGLFGAYFSPLWLPKTTWMAKNLVQWDRVWQYCTFGCYFGPQSFLVAKQVRNRPEPHALGPKNFCIFKWLFSHTWILWVPHV